MPCTGRLLCGASAARIAACCVALLAVAGAATAATPDVKLGLGGYYSKLKGGDGPLPVAEFVTGEAAGKAAPTNQWYSSVMFQRWSQPLHAHPMTYRATEQGFELGLPSKRHADVGGSIELSYPHVPAIVVSPLGIHAEGRAAVEVLRLARAGQHGGGRRTRR